MLKQLLWATLVILLSCENDRVEKEVSLSGLEPAQAIRIEDSSEEVIKLLGQVKTYSDYAEIRGARSYKTRAKIQALDFGVSFVDEYLRTVGGWSINPERQVLGLIGLDKLIKAGFQPSEKVAAIYEHIIRRNSLVSACVSCTGGNYPVKTYLDMLQWDKVPNIDFSPG